MQTLDWAVKYLEMGLSVIPIEPKSKKPTVNWTQYQKRLMTLAEAKILFKPENNIALVCGSLSGVTVIDVDDYKKESGITIESPLVVLTPRLGHHHYFKFTEVRNTANADLAVDGRSEGGYVLVPGSIGANGNMYKWLTEPTKEILQSLPEVPPEILEEVYKQKEKQSGTNQSFDVTQALNLSKGNRNDELHRLAVSLLSKHTEDQAYALLDAANKTASPPLSNQELSVIFNSARSFVTGSPPKKQQEKITENNEFKMTSFCQDLDGVEKQLTEGMQKGIPSGFPSLDKLNGGYIPGQSYLFYADTSVGKSVFALNSLVYMAQHGVKCLYFDLENSMPMTIERLCLIAHGGDINLMDWRLAVENKEHGQYMKKLRELPIYIWDLNKLTDRFGEVTWDGVKRCIDEAVREGVQVVVVDHLHYFNPSETDFSFLADVARQMNNLAAIHNIVTISIAHTKKGLVKENKGRIYATRPTTDHISGSAMIAKHTKNIIGIQRNISADDISERSETLVYVDKNKSGPNGKFACTFGEQTMIFTDGTYLNDPWKSKTEDAEDFIKSLEQQ